MPYSSKEESNKIKVIYSATLSELKQELLDGINLPKRRVVEVENHPDLAKYIRKSIKGDPHIDLDITIKGLKRLEITEDLTSEILLDLLKKDSRASGILTGTSLLIILAFISLFGLMLHDILILAEK